MEGRWRGEGVDYMRCNLVIEIWTLEEVSQVSGWRQSKGPRAVRVSQHEKGQVLRSGLETIAEVMLSLRGRDLSYWSS